MQKLNRSQFKNRSYASSGSLKGNSIDTIVIPSVTASIEVYSRPQSPNELEVILFLFILEFEIYIFLIFLIIVLFFQLIIQRYW